MTRTSRSRGTCGECRFSRPLESDFVGACLPSERAEWLREHCVVCALFADEPLVTMADADGGYGPCEDFEPRGWTNAAR